MRKLLSLLVLLWPFVASASPLIDANTAIDQNITTNGSGRITGQTLNSTLHSITNAIAGSSSGNALALEAYGADPTGTNFSDTAIVNWLADMATQSRDGIVGPGTFKFANTHLFDTRPVYGTGVHIYGQGCNRTRFQYTGTSYPAFRLGTDTLTVGASRGDSFYSKIMGIGFLATIDGPVLQLGRDDMLDPINGGTLDVCTNQGSHTANAQGVRVNGWIDSPYSNIVATNSRPLETDAGTYGTACYIRGASFSNFYGSCSGADVGQHLTATAYQAVFVNIFNSIDMEVNRKDILIDNQGLAPSNNTWIGGQLDYDFANYCAIDAQAGYRSLFINSNLGGAHDFCGKAGLSVIGASYDPLLNQTLVGLGVTATSGQIAIPAVSGSAGLSFTTPGGAVGFNEDASGNGYLSNYGTGTNWNYGVTAGGYHSFTIGATEIERLTASAGITSGVGFTTIYPLIKTAAPTIGSGFGTSPSISSQNGTASFRVNVGTGGSSTTGVINMPASQNGWNCIANDLNTPAANTRQTATGSSSTVTIGNFNSAGTATAWASGDTIALTCMGW